MTAQTIGYILSGVAGFFILMGFLFGLKRLQKKHVQICLACCNSSVVVDFFINDNKGTITDGCIVS